jgi:PAS domain S-box-containing protein
MSERDVPERRTENHIESESRDLFRKLVESIRDYAIFGLDLEGRVQTWNVGAARIKGYRAEEVIGRHFSIFHPQEDRNAGTCERLLLEAMSAGRAESEGWRVRKDGSRFWANVVITAIRGSDGKLTGFAKVTRDITERRNSERERLRLAEERVARAAAEKNEAQRSFFKEVMTALSESLDYRANLTRIAELAVPRLADWCSIDMVADSGGPPRQLAMAHVDPGKVESAKEIRRKYPPDPGSPSGISNVIRTGRAELYETVPEALLLQACVDVEHLRMIRNLGIRSAMFVPMIARDRVLGAITLVYAESGRNYDQDDLEIAMDFARRCAVAVDNARLNAAEQSARQSADLANRAKDEFLATMSHELRTPLTAIMGWAKMMSTANLDEAKRARAVATIDRNAVAMAQLIEDLLDVSRVIGGKMRLDVQALDLVRVVETAIESVKPSAEARAVAIVARLDPAASAFFGDPSRLQQIVWNFLSNAVKFTPADGRVEVVLRSLGTWVELRITDTGKGIESQFLPHVFDPFRQEQSGPFRTRGGLGLGLAITKHLIELHGGSVTAESEGVDRGATFIARLPVAAMAGVRQIESAAGSRETPLDSQFERPSQLRDLRVLVVDDEEDARLLIKTVLEECDSRVVTAPGVDAAMQMFGKGFDVLVSDIGMPELDGYELIRRVRALPSAQGGGIPAVALTAYSRAEDRRRILNAGYSMHVSKPVEPAELVAVLASLVRLMPPHVDLTA